MAADRQADLGTPRREGAAVSLLVDGRRVTVPEGTSRLRLTVMATHRPGELRAAGRSIADAVAAVSSDGDYALELDPGRLAAAEGVDVSDADPSGEITVRAPARAEAPPKSPTPASSA